MSATMLTRNGARWADVLESSRQRAYRTLEHDPQTLLEQDGGPLSRKADLIYARLIGFDDEVVDDIRIRRVESDILMPIMPSLSRLMTEATEPPGPLFRTARYVLQSGFASLRLAAELLPWDVEVGDDFTAELLFLRYRRRE